MWRSVWVNTELVIVQSQLDSPVSSRAVLSRKHQLERPNAAVVVVRLRAKTLGIKASPLLSRLLLPTLPFSAILWRSSRGGTETGIGYVEVAHRCWFTIAMGVTQGAC